MTLTDLKDIHVNANGETYTAKNPTDETPEEFMDIIDRLIHMENVVIEIIGRFVWVSGNTKPYKDILKELNFRWHSQKTAWYLAPDDYKKRNKKKYEMDEIREMFGCKHVDTEPFPKVSASA